MEEIGRDGINIGRSWWNMESCLVAVKVQAGPPLERGFNNGLYTPYFLELVLLARDFL
jgi:hypothetical protein